MFLFFSIKIKDGLWCISKKEEVSSNKIKSLNSMNKIDRQTENSMISFLEKQLSELGIELEEEKAKTQNLSLEKIQMKNNIETLTRVNEKNKLFFRFIVEN